MIKEGYVIKNVTEKKDMAWKVFAYTISYYHEKNENFISSQTFTVEDFKKLYGDKNIKSLPGSSCKIKEELLLN